MSVPAKSNLDLVNDCDRFPYYENDPQRYTDMLSSLYKFYHDRDEDSPPSGYLLEMVVNQMPWNDRWLIDHEKKTVAPRLEKSANGIEYAQSLSKLIEETLLEARAKESFKVLKGWRNELYPVTGLSSQISMERAGSALFGINSYGVHLTAYTNGKDGLKIWVPRRQAHKSTYGGMLDNTVAGGISFGETAIDSLVREAEEEASFSEDLVRKHAKLCGAVSYFMVRDERAGGETGLLQPECQFVYDLELTPDIVPKPNDDEVEEFQLWTVERVQQALAEDKFKPNCALILLDFFVRHGILTPENEKDYVEIISRLHRKLPFSTNG